MLVHPRRVALTALLALAASELAAQAHPSPGTASSAPAGRVRRYYLAVDEVDWTYIPARADQAITGKKDDFTNFPGLRCHDCNVVAGAIASFLRRCTAS